MHTESDYESVRALLSSKKLFVFDMDGTIYLGARVFDFAVKFIRDLRASGRRVLFFTNNASHDPSFYLEKLTRLGFEPKPEEICTAGDVTGAFLYNCRNNKKVYLLGTPELYRHLKRYGVDMVNDERGIPDGRDADIVVTSFDTTLTYEKLTVACDFIRGGAEYICTHPDFNCPTETGFIPDSGAIAAAVTASTGAVPKFMGKPHRETAEMIMKITGAEKEETVMFGDRLYTDIAVGKLHGITSVLVLTGETRAKDVQKADADEWPDVMLESLASAREIMFGEAR